MATTTPATTTAAANVPVEALNLPPLSDPKFVDYFRETKDQNMIIHFYECFKNIDTTKFDKEIHENSKEMLKIIIHQRREFGERCSVADELKNKAEEKLIHFMQENIVLQKKVSDEIIEHNKIKTEMEILNQKYLATLKEKEELEAKFSTSQETANKWVTNAIENYDILGKTKKENEILSADIQKMKKEFKKEKDALEKEIQKLQKEKHRNRITKDGIKEEKGLDQSGSMLRKQITARKLTQQAYISSTPITTSPPSIGRRQSQTCIRQQQQYCTSIFRRRNYTSTTTSSMNQPQPLHQPQPQQRQCPTFPSFQQTRQFMSCIQSQSLTTTSSSSSSSSTAKTATAATKTQIENVSAIPLPPPPTPPTWINIDQQSPHIRMDPFFSMPAMLPPTMPTTSQISNLSPDQQQFYLP